MAANHQRHFGHPPPSDRQTSARGTIRVPETLVYWRRAPNATVRGAISAVRAVEDVEWVKPITSRQIWRMAKNLLPSDKEDRRAFGGLETLQLISQGYKDRVDWTFYRLTVLSFVGVLRVGETVPIRRRGLGDEAMCFQGVKNSRCPFTRDLGAYASAWSDWLKRHGSTDEKGPIFLCPQGPAWLEERIARALVGTEYEEPRWHCWRRGGAALLKWMGVPIAVGQWWDRWARRVAADYIAPAPDFIFTQECSLPWPFGYTKVKRTIVSPYDLRLASVSEYFAREYPSVGASEPSVGSKRAQVETLAGGHALKIGAGIRKPTRCQTRNVSGGAHGDGDGKQLANMVE